LLKEEINNLRNGFLYVVFGDSFNKEAYFSILSLLKNNPSVNVAVFTDEPQPFTNIGKNVIVKKIKPKHIRAKVDFLPLTPFEQTVYLDSDTVIVKNIEDIFDCFSRDDVLVTQCFEREREKYNFIKEYNDIPYSFTEVNGGFLGYKNNKKTKEFLKLWKKYFNKYKKVTSGWDQVSLRIALWNSSVTLNFLPYEYNIRSIENRLKLLNNKKTLGENHLEPRIYHMHYSSDVHNDIFKIKSLEELEKIIKNKAYLI